MNITDQVTSPEVSIKMKQLELPQLSFLTWLLPGSGYCAVYDACGYSKDFALIQHTYIVNSDSNRAFSAYSISEIAKFFGKGTTECEVLHNIIMRKINGGNSIGVIFDADFLAKILIELIENKQTTSFSCGARYLLDK